MLNRAPDVAVECQAARLSVSMHTARACQSKTRPRRLTARRPDQFKRRIVERVRVDARLTRERATQEKRYEE
jgi:hypothetical protein